MYYTLLIGRLRIYEPEEEQEEDQERASAWEEVMLETHADAPARRDGTHRDNLRRINVKEWAAFLEATGLRECLWAEGWMGGPAKVTPFTSVHLAAVEGARRRWGTMPLTQEGRGSIQGWLDWLAFWLRHALQVHGEFRGDTGDTYAVFSVR